MSRGCKPWSELLAVLLSASCRVVAQAAFGQDYPSKPVASVFKPQFRPAEKAGRTVE